MTSAFDTGIAIEPIRPRPGPRPHGARMGQHGGTVRRYHRGHPAARRAGPARLPRSAGGPDGEFRRAHRRRRFRHRAAGRADQPVEPALDHRTDPGRRDQDHRHGTLRAAPRDLGGRRDGDAGRPSTGRCCGTGVSAAGALDAQLRDGVPRRRGAPADTGPDPSSTTTLWMRNTPPRPLDFPARRRCATCSTRASTGDSVASAPAGTISMNIYFPPTSVRSRHRATTSSWARRGQTRFSLGYFGQTAELFGRDGTLLASTQQIVYFKD